MKKNNNSEKVIIQASGYKNGKPVRICPKYGEEKSVDEGFGYRKINKENGPVTNQSRCKKNVDNL